MNPPYLYADGDFLRAYSEALISAQSRSSPPGWVETQSGINLVRSLKGDAIDYVMEIGT